MTTLARVRTVAVAVAAPAIDTALFSRLTEDPTRLYWVREHVPVAVVLVAGGLLVPALLARRRAPVAVLVLVAAYAAVLTVTIGSRPLISVAVLVFTVAADRPRRTALLSLVPVAAAQSLAVAYEVVGLPARQRVLDAVLVAILFLVVDGVAWGLGTWAGWTIRQRELTALRAAADAVARERRAIARDMHDVVAHAVTLMMLQAAGAVGVLRSDPERARDALAQVHDLGHQAVVELHRMVRVLGDDAARAAPAGRTGLADLPDLLRHTAAGSPPVDLAVTGSPRPLDAGIDLAAFRIVQEAVTNATRYAAPDSPVSVRIAWSSSDIELVVDNQVGPAAATTRRPSGGFGLTAMRERARSVGGVVEVGPRSDGTFVVRARIPLTATGGRAR